VQPVKEISVEELAKWRAGEKAFVLVDVRHPNELKLAALPDAVNVPLHELAARLGELDGNVPIALICHTGARSEFAARFLASNGFADACTVVGGIDAYSARVDPSIPRY